MARRRTQPVLRFILRAAAYLWALPTTAVGLLFLPLALLSGGRAAWVQGAIEIHGGLVAWLLRHGTLLPGGAAALTLGHVVLGLNSATLQRTRAHERVHVRQAERWGPLFIPAYLLASAWMWLRQRDAYFDNPFEREAYDEVERRIGLRGGVD